MTTPTQPGWYWWRATPENESAHLLFGTWRPRAWDGKGQEDHVPSEWGHRIPSQRELAKVRAENERLRSIEDAARAAIKLYEHIHDENLAPTLRRLREALSHAEGEKP